MGTLPSTETPSITARLWATYKLGLHTHLGLFLLVHPSRVISLNKFIFSYCEEFATLRLYCLASSLLSSRASALLVSSSTAQGSTALTGATTCFILGLTNKVLISLWDLTYPIHLGDLFFPYDLGHFTCPLLELYNGSFHLLYLQQDSLKNLYTSFLHSMAILAT
eukprot:Gb_05797 [translate_table: standard]